MKRYNCKQYTDAWYTAKLGIPTASQFHNVITPLGAPTRGDRRMKLMYRLIAERLLKQSMDSRFENEWTRRGKALEEEAVQAFSASCKKPPVIEDGGFVTTDDGRIGCSPDRVLARGKEGLEIKCPSPWVQVEYLLEGIEENYKPQVQGQMLVCDFALVHLWCWHPLMPPVHVQTLRDDEFIEKLAKELYHFCNELDAETERAQRRGPYTLAKVLRLSAELSDDIPGTFPWTD